jgi:hypothetical protein
MMVQVRPRIEMEWKFRYGRSVRTCEWLHVSECGTLTFNSCFLPKRLMSTASWLVPSVRLLLSVPTRISNPACLDMLGGGREKMARQHRQRM